MTIRIGAVPYLLVGVLVHVIFYGNNVDLTSFLIIFCWPFVMAFNIMYYAIPIGIILFTILFCWEKIVRKINSYQRNRRVAKRNKILKIIETSKGWHR